MCKPHKMGGAVRWKSKDLELAKVAEKEIERYNGRSSLNVR